MPNLKVSLFLSIGYFGNDAPSHPETGVLQKTRSGGLEWFRGPQERQGPPPAKARRALIKSSHRAWQTRTFAAPHASMIPPDQVSRNESRTFNGLKPMLRVRFFALGFKTPTPLPPPPEFPLVQRLLRAWSGSGQPVREKGGLGWASWNGWDISPLWIVGYAWRVMSFFPGEKKPPAGGVPAVGRTLRPF